MKAKMIRITIAAVLLVISFCAQARVYLVSAGIADYSGFPTKTSSLRLTTKDAKAIADLYSKNSSVDYALLLDDKATKDRIVKAIKKVFNQAKEDDIVVFFFSGHGYPGGFCAYDGKIGYSEIIKAMSGSKSRNKMIFTDACRAGGMRVDAKASQSDTDAAKNANLMLFLSSRNTENSIERKDMQNGFFTTYLINGLKGNADANRDRVITAKELFDFVSKGVAKISADKQHPVMWGKFSDNMPVMKW